MVVGCTECPCVAILGDGAAVQSPWGHKGVGVPQEGAVTLALEPSQTCWALQVWGSLPAPGLCYYGQITCGTLF